MYGWLKRFMEVVVASRRDRRRKAADEALFGGRFTGGRKPKAKGSRARTSESVRAAAFPSRARRSPYKSAKLRGGVGGKRGRSAAARRRGATVRSGNATKQAMARKIKSSARARKNPVKRGGR